MIHNPPVSNRFRALFAVICGVFLAGVVFCARRPVVLVNDAAFALLYGKRRAWVKKAGLELLLFRRIKTAVVAESAGPDLVSLAAAMASKRPYAVFFPYRYREGALRYHRDHPDAPAALLAGRKKPPESAAAEGGGLAWYSTDTPTDLYRAGFCAAALAGDGEILVIHSGALAPEETAAFRAGAGTASVSFAPPGMNAPERTACAVLPGTEKIPEGDTELPFILYTWLDPALLPEEAAVVFSDSPWEALPAALALLEEGQLLGTIPSEITVLGKKTRDLSTVQIKRLIFSPAGADN
ncbi:MAG: hypothetical protein LBI67_08730 [Treponema sp.]|nr:hypothetical protein [Treponema sp.]